MTQYYLTIFADLMEINSTNPVVIPDPFMNNRSLTSNVKMFYRLIRWSINTNDCVGTLVNAYYLGYLFEERLSTPSLRRQHRNVLSKHYLDACIRVYSLYRIVGIQQIYRSKRTSFWMFRKIKRTSYVQLIQDALTLS